jgi:hypothetical protein
MSSITGFRTLLIYCAGLFVILLALGTLFFFSFQSDFSYYSAFLLSFSALHRNSIFFAEGLPQLTAIAQYVLMALMQLSSVLWMWLCACLISMYHQQSDTRLNLLRVLVFTCIAEVLAFGGYSMLWNAEFALISATEKMRHAMFMAVSVFTHSGFTLYAGGFSGAALQPAYLIQLVSIPILVVGGLGAYVLWDMYSPHKLRHRLVHPQEHWAPFTRIALYTSVALLLCGAVLFYFIPHTFTADEDKIVVKGIHSLFQAAGWSGAGFSLLSTETLAHVPLLLLAITLFMFIGTAFGANGGGISTLALFACISGQHVSGALRAVAMDVLRYTLLCIFSATVIQWAFQPKVFILQHLVSSVSAYSGAGISSLTEFSWLQQVLGMLLMLAGKPVLLWRVYISGCQNGLFTSIASHPQG